VTTIVESCLRPGCIWIAQGHGRRIRILSFDGILVRWEAENGYRTSRSMRDKLSFLRRYRPLLPVEMPVDGAK
jgi:hypothetical protein